MKCFPHESLIYCADEESVPIKVKITGNDDFERIIAAAVQPSDTLAAVNNACDFFCSLPPRSAEHLKRDVLENGLTSLSDFFSRIFREEKETVVEQFYFPLSVTLYPYNDYGDLDEENAEELDGTFAADYEFTIRTRLEKEQRGFDMAETFDGSDSAVEKLRFVKWNVEEIDGCLYGKILARLTEPFDPEERAEFVDWALGQNSDGLGESFEQRPFKTDDGEMYVSFWKHAENARLLVRHKAQGGGKWRKDAEAYVAQVESAFMDLDNNFRRWLSLQPCVFDHPLTHNHTEIMIGDDCEAIFHFLVYCRKIHKGEPIDEDFSDYLAYLISRSVYTEDV